MGRRTRAVVMLGAAAVCAGVALTAMRDESARVRSQVGGPVPVVVVTRSVPAGMHFTAQAAVRHLAVRSVPERFVPPSALAAVDDAVGHRVAGAMEPGDYLTSALLRRVSARRPGPGSQGVSRLVEVEVAGASTIAPLLRPGARVDVLITTQAGRGSPRTYLAMQDVGLAAFSAREAATDAPDLSGIASLRVSLREAVLLTAAQSFARELRLVPRPAGASSVPRLQVRERDL